MTDNFSGVDVFTVPEGTIFFGGSRVGIVKEDRIVHQDGTLTTEGNKYSAPGIYCTEGMFHKLKETVGEIE